MKKLFLILVVLFTTTFVFAEDVSIFGLTFGMKKSDIKSKNLQDKIESAMDKDFELYTDIEFELFYDKADCLRTIKIASDASSKDYLLLAKWIAYFKKNLKCDNIDNMYYNDDIVATIETKSPKNPYNSFYILIESRKEMDKLIDKYVNY